MSFENNLLLKDNDYGWAEKRPGYRKIIEVSILFVYVVSSYEAEPTDSNSFSMSLNLSPITEVKITKSVNKRGEEVAAKEFKN